MSDLNPLERAQLIILAPAVWLLDLLANAVGRAEYEDVDLCIGCETEPVREYWQTVHDDGTEESMATEAFAGRSLYCQTCYDAAD